MPKINVAITLDKNYLQHAAVMLFTLIKNNPNTDIHLYAICDDKIEDEDWTKLSKVYQGSRLVLEKVRIDPAHFSNFKLSDHATLANYYRIQMAELLPENIDKLLYLDVDIVVLKDLLELYRTDIDNYYVAAIEDPDNPVRFKFGFSPSDPYFNSGIMLINLAAWRRDNLLKKLTEFILNNAALIQYWDQDAFNVVCKGHWKALAPKYNVQTNLFYIHSNAITYTYEDIQNAIADPYIIHFTGKSKPWEYMDKHPVKEIYYKYLRKTPWKNFKPADKTIVNILRKHKLMPQFMEKIIQNR
ncbi:MAG: glycosyltransferase family 8 protein [Bacteroidota bacterium]